MASAVLCISAIPAAQRSHLVPQKPELDFPPPVSPFAKGENRPGLAVLAGGTGIFILGGPQRGLRNRSETSDARIASTNWLRWIPASAGMTRCKLLDFDRVPGTPAVLGMANSNVFLQYQMERLNVGGHPGDNRLLRSGADLVTIDN